jgi:hypothetical protein
MPGKDDHEELSAEDLAELDEYENSEEGKEAGKPTPETPAEKLTKLFLKTPEMRECRLTADSINKRLNQEDTVAVQIMVPREFLRLTEFLEQKRAVAAGVEPVPPREVLSQILVNELHDQLHALTTGPARFSYYRELWNRFCDAHGAPEQKIAEPGAGEKGTANDEPF